MMTKVASNHNFSMISGDLVKAVQIPQGSGESGFALVDVLAGPRDAQHQILTAPQMVSSANLYHI